MSKTIRSVDDIGRSWIIYEGDPAWEVCQSLDRAGVEWVVLPTMTLITGEVASYQDIDKDAPLSPSRIRMRDCLAWLQENYTTD